MKNEIILWLSSFAILFLIGYVKSVTDKDYPITSTFGIEGRKVSYKMDKVSFDKTAYTNLIISDIKGIKAKIILMDNNLINEFPFYEVGKGLECKIPNLKPGTRVEYRIVISFNERKFEIPENEFVRLTFWNYIPSPIKILFSLLLYGGLLMAIRSLLEIFNSNKNLKKYLFIGCALFILLNIIVNPLYISYKLGAINKFVPSIGDLVNPFLIAILLLLIAGTILIFNKFHTKAITIIISFGAIVLFFFI